MKILVVYGSTFGQAEAVARAIAHSLEVAGHAVVLYKGDAVPNTLAVADYDGIVVAASIVIGKYQGYIRKFVARNVAVLNERPSAFVSVNGTVPETAEWRAIAQTYTRHLLDESGWQPDWTANFAGALRFPRYNAPTRWIMKQMSKVQGGPTDVSREYEYTDWSAVESFSQTLAAGFGGGNGGHSP